MKKNTIQGKLFDCLLRHKERVALEYGLVKITYGELLKRSSAVAGYLRRNGIIRNEFVGIYLENRVDFICALIGILRAGAAFVPLDPELPLQRIQEMIRNTGMKTLFTTEQGKNELTGTDNAMFDGCAMIDLQTIFQEAPSAACEETDYSPDDKIYIYFTSGTTGTPKAIIGKNKSLLHFIDWEISTFGIDESIRVSQFISLGFDAYLRDLFVPLCAGGTVCIPENKETIMDGKILLQWIDHNQINLIHCVPSIFRLFNIPSLTNEHFKKLKYVLLSGERIIPIELEDWYKTFGDRIQLVNLYGPSETTMVKAYYLIQKDDVKRSTMPIGKPMKGAQVLILDDHMNLCDCGIAGEIYIRTPYRTHGYHNAPDLNEKRFIRNPFTNNPEDRIYKTGDLGRELMDGNIELLGRIDRQVKMRGVRVELEEIENTLLQHPGVDRAVVTVHGEDEKEKVLCAYVLANNNKVAANSNEIAASASQEASKSVLSQDEMTRYKRQLILDGWGVASQEKVKRTTVLAAGAGGSGSPTIIQLALIGFGTIIVCDFDNVELSNLNRQCLHDDSRIGMNKAESAAKTIKTINPHVNVIVRKEMITRDNVHEIVGNADIIFDNVDDIFAKFLLSEVAVQKGIPHIISSMIDINGYAAVFHTPRSACFHCLYDRARAEDIMAIRALRPDYQKAPLAVVPSPLFLSTGFITTEALKILLGIGKPAYNKYFIFNQKGAPEIADTDGYQQVTFFFSDHFRDLAARQGYNWERGGSGRLIEEIEVEPDPHCRVCGGKPADATATDQSNAEASGPLKLRSNADAPSMQIKNLVLPLTSAVRDFTTHRLPAYMIPTYFIEISELPLKPNGKVDYQRLPIPTDSVVVEHVAPRTPVENQLAELWASVLEIRKSDIGVHSDFFHVGGYSLKATLLVSRIQKELNVKMPLVEIFRTPTLEGLSRYIEQELIVAALSAKKGTQTGDYENMVLLKKGQDHGQHLFISHAANGQVETYIDFCQLLNPQLNYWGMRSDKVENFTPNRQTNEAVAAKYIEQIKAIQPSGPYWIAGYCLGGPIALEVVRQLEERRERVAFFGLIDSNVPMSDYMKYDVCDFTRETELKLIQMLTKEEDILEEVRQVADVERLWPKFIECMTRKNADCNYAKEAVIQHIPDVMRGIDKEVIPNYEQIAIKELITFVNLIRGLRNARASYRPKNKIKTPVHYFEADRTFIKTEEKALWNELFVKPMTSYTVPGNHYSIFWQPEVKVVAEVFDRTLSQALVSTDFACKN